MTTITDFDPVIQFTLRSFAGSSLQEIANEVNLTKQAIHKKVQAGIEYLKGFGVKRPQLVPKFELDKALEENKNLSQLNLRLRQELILAGVQRQLLKLFKVKVLEIFPRFKIGRLPAREKKQILDWLLKFKSAGGLLKDFAGRIKMSPGTLLRWQESYEKYGLNGLIDKITRPKNFGNTVPLWLKDSLLRLFLKFPRWSAYQYHSYIRNNPTIHWHLSLATIQKLKNMHQQKSEEEKERLKKRWCFARGTNVWTIDFTCIIKTEHFKLQLLTVSDQRSRFLFPTALFLNTSTDTVINHLKNLFLKFGKPMIIKADNGPEFRIECSEQLRELSVYLLNSPQYYGQFCGAHERIHRTIKAFIDDFSKHQNITQLVHELTTFEEQHNYSMPSDYLEGKTPANVYFSDPNFIPKGAEIVTPYTKENELRMKFTDRDNNPARITMPIID
jgi:predicted DNA-binding protein YlxM (UPF0122 family)